MDLKNFRNIPFGVSMLDAIYPSNKALVAKAHRLESDHQILRLKRGLYIVNPYISGSRINEFLLANHLYGPSYVSKESALRYYGLIPERVFATTSMTTGLSKTFTNKISSFIFTHCPVDYYNIGVTLHNDNDVNYLIATPEKALCDLMIYTSGLNIRFMKEMRIYLEEDLRLEMQEIGNLNIDLLKEIRDHGKKKTMITQLIKIVENERNV